MLGAITGPPEKRKKYTLVRFTNATAYIHPTRVHYRFRGESPEDRDQLAKEFAFAYHGEAKKLPGKDGLIACIEGDFRSNSPHPEA